MIQSRVIAAVLAFAVLILAAPSNAQVFEAREFEDPYHARRYHALINELRCLVCQNQNIADSNAPLAADLRQITFDMIREGRSDGEIIDFMVARYGDFVLYRPPLNPATLFLWVGPFLLLALGIWLLMRQLRRRASAPEAAGALSVEERTRLSKLIDDEQDRGSPPRQD